MSFAIKADIQDAGAAQWSFVGQKTMYGGKRIAAGDSIYIFASENEGGRGLIARGRVLRASGLPKMPDKVRQTPRVSLSVQVTARAKRALGRSELKLFTEWDDPRAEVELNFKLYRQATNKVVGISPAAAAFLERFF